MCQKRNGTIDILRCIGTFLVILAHVGAPNLIMNIRTFDVVLLVFISAICSLKSGNISSLKDYCAYVLKRIKRLIIPTYSLLIFMFPCFLVLYVLVFRRDFFWTKKQIIDTFLLLDSGIGYIWIVRIYIIIALFMPLMKYIKDRLNNLEYNLVLILISICTEIVVWLSNRGIISNLFFDNYFCYMFSYLLICGIAIEYIQKTIKVRIYYSILTSVLFIVFQMYYFCKGSGFETSNHKYPPSLYWVFYGLAVSCILYLICDKIHIHNKVIQNYIVWLSENSFNIYLIHIPAIFILKSVFTHYLGGFSWYILYFFIVLFSIMGAWLLNQFINMLKNHMLLRKNDY